jgi:hypothetical protein
MYAANLTRRRLLHHAKFVVEGTVVASEVDISGLSHIRIGGNGMG